jgi:DNA-binding MarR family transcriptional regulator
VTPDDSMPNNGSGDPIDSRLADALERVGHVLRTQIRAAGAGHGLSPIQAQLLMRIATVDQPGREPARLAGWFDVSRPTVSDATAALRRKDLLTHEPVSGDRRRTRLVLTPSGRKVAGQLAGWDESVRAELAALPPSAKASTLTLLLDLIGGMQQSGLVSVARTCTTCRFYRPHTGPVSAGHCTLLDVPLPPASLRLDCPEHERVA